MDTVDAEYHLQDGVDVVVDGAVRAVHELRRRVERHPPTSRPLRR